MYFGTRLEWALGRWALLAAGHLKSKCHLNAI